MTNPTLQETRILPAQEEAVTVEVTVADHPDEKEAKFYLRGRCTFRPQTFQGDNFPYLIHVQRQALHELREVLDAEIQRLSSRGGQ